MKICDNLNFSNGKVEVFSLDILANGREIMPNLLYKTSGSDKIIVDVRTGKILIKLDHNLFDFEEIDYEKEGIKFIYITNPHNNYLYEIELNTGNIYRSSYLIVKQEGDKEYHLLYNENIDTYRNIIIYFKEKKADLVKDLFVKVNDTYVNFLDINTNPEFMAKD